MSAFSNRMKATALRLLTQYGENVDATRTISVFNPATGTTSNTISTYSGKGYPSNYSNQDIDGVLILQSDTLLILSTTTRPIVNDVMTVNNKTMTARNVQIVTASGDDVVYKVQLRQ